MEFDKKLHLISGASIALVIGLMFGFTEGLIASFIAGVAKEVYDSFGYGTPDIYDMFYTWAGSVIGVTLAFFISM